MPKFARTLPIVKRAAAASLLSVIVLTSGTAGTVPFRPEDDSEVLQHLPLPDDRERRALRQSRQALAAAPDDLGRALDLARRYLSIGRRESDPRYYGYAEAALGPWLGQELPPAEVLVLRAVILQSRHAFEAALADLDRVLAMWPDHAQARLSQAFILLAQGRIAEAGESCRQLPGHVANLIIATCQARVASLSGDAAGARTTLEGALAEAGDAENSIRLWALTNLADIAERTGDSPAAEIHYREALAQGRRDTYLIAAYADFLIDRDRHIEVLRLLDGDTGPDALLLRLVLAEQALGDRRSDAHAAELAARFAAARQRGDQRHLRAEARYQLLVRRDAPAALDLALENWRTQREPIDTRLVLEAAIAAGAPDRVDAVLRWLEETGLDDVRLARSVTHLGAGAP